MSEYYLNAPFSEEEIRALRIGDIVYVSGKAFTCRSRLHRWVFDEGHPFPAAIAAHDLLIHVGPIVLPQDNGWHLVSFMPTSSIRFEKWGARSVDQWGLRMIIGKTTMGSKTMDMMRLKGCVHVSPQSVSPNLWVPSIKVTDVELFNELGSIEATWYMELDQLGPFIVDIDAEGNNLFEAIDKTVEANKIKALETLDIPKDFSFTKLY